jgi:hypothetical protein
MAEYWFLSPSRRSRSTPSDGGSPQRELPDTPSPGAGNLATGRARSRQQRQQASEAGADLAAEALANGRETARAGRQRTPRPMLTPPSAGRALPDHLLSSARAAVGDRVNQLRLHDGAEARDVAGALGAKAFYDGGNIWLGPGASEHDRELLLHELGHAAQGEEGVYLRSATWLERRAWLGFFDHYLPRKFLNNYMDDTGAPITLTQQEMIDVNPIVNIARSPKFQTELAALQAQVQASNVAATPAPAVRFIDVTGPGQAMTNGTLGNFTIHYRGLLTVTTSGDWIFLGTMSFYDVWDFDPKPFGTSGRSTAGELKTRVAAAFLPGSSFEIFSVDTLCIQTGSDPRAVWAGGAPHHVPDKAGRAGADIAVGDVGGGEVGGEVGAQSAEDLNR